MNKNVLTRFGLAITMAVSSGCAGSELDRAVSTPIIPCSAPVEGFQCNGLPFDIPDEVLSLIDIDEEGNNIYKYKQIRWIPEVNFVEAGKEFTGGINLTVNHSEGEYVVTLENLRINANLSPDQQKIVFFKEIIGSSLAISFILEQEQYKDLLLPSPDNENYQATIDFMDILAHYILTDRELEYLGFNSKTYLGVETWDGFSIPDSSILYAVENWADTNRFGDDFRAGVIAEMFLDMQEE